MIGKSDLKKFSKILAYKSACIFSVTFGVVSFYFFFVSHFSCLGRADLRFFEENAKWDIMAKVVIFDDHKVCVNLTGAAEVRNFVFQELKFSQFLNLREEGKVVEFKKSVKGKQSKAKQNVYGELGCREFHVPDCHLKCNGLKLLLFYIHSINCMVELKENRFHGVSGNVG